jgi:hypothetical protein
LKLIIPGDINIDFLTDIEREKQLDAVLLSYNLTGTFNFPTRVQNESNMAIDESWDSIFTRSKNDKMDVDSLFNIFLNNYLRIIYTSFPLIKIIQRHKSRQ